MILPLSTILSAASATAEPPSAAERDAKEPRPKVTISVSPETKRTAAGSRPSRSQAIWVKVVAWPWP